MFPCRVTTIKNIERENIHWEVNKIGKASLVMNITLFISSFSCFFFLISRSWFEASR